MKRIILGTAGHIDHGKTALVKALTGVECDRLKEEKKRGITIELGFASLSLPDGQQAGIVDVPGHEKFIKHMVAGVGGIDGVILVVAADEGVMPQTREHLDICRLLAVKKGIVALTKSDLVDREWLEMVREDVGAFVQRTFLEGAPIISVSSTTGSGIDTLLSALERLVQAITQRPASSLLRLPIDRVFSMKGFGTVVTGSLLAGEVSVGDEVEILPEGVIAKVRGVQVYNVSAASATAGQRTALNFQGVDKGAVKRGSVVVRPGSMAPCESVIAWCEHLKSAPRPLKNRTRVRFHAGTSEVLARVMPLGDGELGPGCSGAVRLVFEGRAVVLPHDRYVLRSYSPVVTVGGGELLDICPPRKKWSSESMAQRLHILRNGSIEDVLLLLCREAGFAGVSLQQLQARCGIEQQKLVAHIDRLRSRGAVIAFSRDPLQLADPAVLEALEKQVLELTAAFHRDCPLKAGLLKEELRGMLGLSPAARLYSFVLERLIRQGRLVLSREFLCLPGHRPAMSGGQRDLRRKIVSLYRTAGSAPPTRKELLAKLKVPDKDAAGLLDLLVREGVLAKVSDDLLFDAEALRRIVADIVAYGRQHRDLTIQSVKDLTGLTRKFIIPLFEYLDRSRVTLRIGDKRVLRGQDG